MRRALAIGSSRSARWRGRAGAAAGRAVAGAADARAGLSRRRDAQLVARRPEAAATRSRRRRRRRSAPGSRGRAAAPRRRAAPRSRAPAAVARRRRAAARGRPRRRLDGAARARRSARRLAAAAPATLDAARALAARARVPAADALLARRAPTRRSRSPRSPGRQRARRGRRGACAPTCWTRTTAALRSALDDVPRGDAPGSTARAPRPRRSRRGYWRIVEPAYLAQRGAAAARANRRAARRRSSAAARDAGAATALARRGSRARSRASARRRSPTDEQLRRAGQFLRFLELVPVEYGRGVSDGRVTLDFEIQEAITFRDGAAQRVRRPRGDRSSRRDPAATERSRRRSTQLGADLARPPRAATGGRPRRRQGARPTSVLDAAGTVFPERWKDAAETADFDVIAATLDRVEAAAAAGRTATGRAGAARGLRVLRVRARAAPARPRARPVPEGRGATSGTATAATTGLVAADQRGDAARRSPQTRARSTRRSPTPRRASARAASSRVAVVTNTRDHRLPRGPRGRADPRRADGEHGRRAARPAPAAATRRGGALAASAVTWVVAQTVLTRSPATARSSRRWSRSSRSRVLLLILNWFFHRVYWTEHLAGLHGARSAILARRGGGASRRRSSGSSLLGFSSVYREGFETVLFLQAIVARGRRADGAARRPGRPRRRPRRRRLVDRAPAEAAVQEDADRDGRARHLACSP